MKDQYTDRRHQGRWRLRTAQAGDAAGETRLTNTREGWIPVPTAAPVGFPTSHFPFLSSAVNRRIPGVSPCRLEGWRTERLRKSVSGGPEVSEAWGYGDLTLKVERTEITHFSWARRRVFLVSLPAANARSLPNCALTLKLPGTRRCLSLTALLTLGAETSLDAAPAPWRLVDLRCLPARPDHPRQRAPSYPGHSPQ